jgi:hypothetical protein
MTDDFLLSLLDETSMVNSTIDVDRCTKCSGFAIIGINGDFADGDRTINHEFKGLKSLSLWEL